MGSSRTYGLGVALTALGAAGVLVLHWMVFFWVDTEASMGIVQRIFYVHVPAAWVAFLAFGIVALCGAVYLWIGDDRLDRAALAAAEGGMVFTTIVLLTGPLWAKIAWGTWWEWEPRLVTTLLLWFIYAGYFMVRGAAENPERGRRFAAVVGVVGALDIPIIHVSVTWYRALHPEPVVLRQDGPALPGDMLATLLTGVAAFTLLFLGMMTIRYGVERAARLAERPPAPGSPATEMAP